jgi:integrase
MRALVISDIHSNPEALEAVLAAAIRYDTVWNLGDIVGYVALYIADLASCCASATITRRLTAITKAHQAAGYIESPSSARQGIVSETLKGIRRTIGTAQKGKDPLLTSDVKRVVGSSPDRLLGLRDNALVLVGFAGGFRRSELSILNCEDVTFNENGALINLRDRRLIKRGKGARSGCPGVRNLTHVRNARCVVGWMRQGYRRDRFLERLTGMGEFLRVVSIRIRSGMSSNVLHHVLG